MEILLSSMFLVLIVLGMCICIYLIVKVLDLIFSLLNMFIEIIKEILKP
jgi:hypothetical protein